MTKEEQLKALEQAILEIFGTILFAIETKDQGMLDRIQKVLTPDK